MIILVKILFVAIAVFGQAKLFPEGKAPVETEFERITLPVDNPELVLARRAMKAEGLCDSPVHRNDTAAVSTGASPVADTADLTPLVDYDLAHLAESCF